MAEDWITDAVIEKQETEYRRALRAGAHRLHRCWQIQGVRLMEKPAHAIADPRARSYPQDSQLWGLLLAWAYGDEALAYNHGDDCARSLYGALHGLRCGGARLEVKGRAARLRPGDWPEGEYADLRARYLLPHAERLRELLSRLGNWAKEREDSRTPWSELAQEAML